MKERVDPERSSEFNRTFLLSACLAIILAVLIVGLYYGCAKSSRPERPSRPPAPSGVKAQLTKFASIPAAAGSFTAI